MKTLAPIAGTSMKGNVPQVNAPSNGIVCLKRKKGGKEVLLYGSWSDFKEPVKMHKY